VTLREDLYDAVTRGARQLLGADACQLWRLDHDAGELTLAAAGPPDGPAPDARPGRAALLLELMHRERAERAGALQREVDDECLLVAPLVAGDEQLGILCCLARGRTFTDEDAGLLRAVANQTALGLKKAELIERLTAENIVKDMFEALAAGSVETAEAKAAEARCDLGRPHVLLHAERAAGDHDGPPWPDVAARVQTRLRRLYPHVFLDARHDSLRALVPLARVGPETVDQLVRSCDELAREHELNLGLSSAGRGAANGRRLMREAADAARIGRSLAAGGGAIAYEELGAYRYLVHLEFDEAPHDRYGQAVEALLEYDSRRGAQLVETLERFLGSRSSVAASARALYIHPNTVRQRLDRIEQITGLNLHTADLLSLELALKVARLHRVRER
jgi:PucR C-terminal helix-turn-helix domain/GAF domain/GGDEF-like domain